MNWCGWCAAAGVDRQVKVWDVRTFQPLHAYFANSPATALDISQRGLLAVGQGRRLQVGSWDGIRVVAVRTGRGIVGVHTVGGSDQQLRQPCNICTTGSVVGGAAVWAGARPGSRVSQSAWVHPAVAG